jgi:hypothetical protein
MWLLATSACLARTPPAPMALADGGRLASPGPLRFALVGDLAEADDVALADVRAQAPAFVVLAGDAVRRGTPGAWADLHARLGELPAVPVPGRGERRGDRHLARFAGAWEGLGVRGLADPVPWRAFDLASEGTSWRVVVVDADRDALGDRWADELFWIPKAVTGDAPLLVVANRPVRSLSSGWEPAASAGMAEILALVRRHADPTRLVLVAAGGATSPELALPGGPWGEGWLGVGRAGGEGEALLRSTDDLALAPDLDAALAAWFGDGGADADPGRSWTPPDFPVLGWWLVELDGHALSATLRMEGAGGWAPAFTARWSPDTGWTSGR